MKEIGFSIHANTSIGDRLTLRGRPNGRVTIKHVVRVEGEEALNLGFSELEPLRDLLTIAIELGRLAGRESESGNDQG